MMIAENTAGAASAAELQARRMELDAWLSARQWLWRPQPFKEPHPAWCETLPDLTRELLRLDDAQLQCLAGEPNRLAAFLLAHVPHLDLLPRLTELPAATSDVAGDCGPRLRVGIPGRKRAQIEALAAAVAPSAAPLLEWCGGKGHLGRLLAARWNASATTLERNAQLCAQGQRLATHGHVMQRFLVADALSGAAAQAAEGHHVVALHACGELHRTLVRHAATVSMPALDMVPCCYHHLSSTPYQPFCGGTTLTLTGDDLRLAVTDAATSGQRVIHQRDQDMAWKLGFDAMRRATSATWEYRPMLPVPKRWLQWGFEGYCRALAEREKFPLPAHVDWITLERAAWQRQAQVMRLSLVRHGFRRAIELWLVLDLACYLADLGYQVRIATFCDWRTTPRNILVSARG